MKKLPIFLAVLMISLLVVACSSVIYFFLIIVLGVDDLTCSEIVDVSADVDGDGNVDQDMNGDGIIDLNDQILYEYQLELFDLCKKIVRFLLTTALGTIEVHDANSGQWVVLTKIPEQFDLLELQGGKLKVMVYRDNIPPGQYDKLRIDLEKIEIVTTDGKKTAIMPSKEIIIDTNIVVAGNSKSAVELKIDLIKSLHMAEDEQIIFAPVIDVKSRKNIDVKILNKNKKLVSILGGSLLKSEKFGMDLDGKMRKDFVLDRNVALSVENGKVVTKRAVTTSPAGMPTTVEAPVTQPSVLESTSNKAMESAKAAQEEVTAVTIQAKKWVFQPFKITAKKGETVRLNIIPAVGFQFTFALPDFGIGQEITGPTTIEFIADKAGQFTFLCKSCESFRGMKGILTVEEGASGQKMMEEKSSSSSNTIPITLSATAKPLVGVAPLTVQFLAVAANGQEPLTYSWDYNADGAVDSTQQNPMTTLDHPGEYTVMVTVMDATGNTAQKMLSIMVFSSPTHVVEITNNGFNPSTLAIQKGDRVSFINLNKKISPDGIVDAWPASAVHPTHQAYPSSGITKCGTIEQATIFDACGRIHQDESWSFVFNEVGTWNYHDHLDPSKTGKVIVTESVTAAPETTVTIQAKKWLFQPYKILVKKGKVIQLNIIPALGLQFTFAIPEYGIEQEITGQTAIKFKADKAGTFKFLCSSCEEFRNMKGALVVEDTATTVEITASGFVPQIISITAGDTVTWTNENIADAWPASAVHPTHQAYPGSNINKCGTIEQATIFDACGRLHQDESWSFVFTQPGTWKYHNHLNPTYTGTVIVQ